MVTSCEAWVPLVHASVVLKNLPSGEAADGREQECNLGSEGRRVPYMSEVRDLDKYLAISARVDDINISVAKDSQEDLVETVGKIAAAARGRLKGLGMPLAAD